MTPTHLLDKRICGPLIRAGHVHFPMKIPCMTCGAAILLITAHTTGGICMACQQGTRAKMKVRRRIGPAEACGSQRYYYSTDGSDVNGPLTNLTIWERLRARILPRTLQVCLEGSEQWTVISLPASDPAPAVPPGPATGVALGEAQRSEHVVAIIRNYGWGAMGAMVAIPVPGADTAATVAVWGKMIHEIAGVYGYDISLEDAKSLGSDLFRSVVLTTAAWFASAKMASFVFKFIPVAGTAAGYAIDAAIAGLGARKITARLGTAAALYYQSGKTMAPQTMAAHVANVADPETIRRVLGLFAFGVQIDSLERGLDPGRGYRVPPRKGKTRI